MLFAYQIRSFVKPKRYLAPWKRSGFRGRYPIPSQTRGLSVGLVPELTSQVSVNCSEAENTDTENNIRQSIRSLCAKYPGAYWREKDKAKTYPSEFVQELSDAGFLSILIPTEYGGSGLPLKSACIVMEEIHRSGCNGSAAHAQIYTMGSILRYGSEEQKMKHLPMISAGKARLQAFGVSEPDCGTDTLSLRTTALRNGDEYVINGTKIWTSRAQHSDLMLLLARTSSPESGTPRTECLSTFIVDIEKAKSAGAMKIQPIETMINHNTCQIFFENLRVPASDLLGEEGMGFKYILGSMNAERILIASECLGDARFFIDRSVAYAKERHVFGQPIGKNQGVAFPIAESYAALEAAAMVVKAALALYDSGMNCGSQANLAKYLASEASWKAAEAAMQTFGGFAFATEYDVERKWREARLYRTAPNFWKYDSFTYKRKSAGATPQLLNMLVRIALEKKVAKPQRLSISLM